jgi:hypothetical protein
MIIGEPAMDLPNIQSVFDFDFTSDLGKRYDGRFTVLCVLDMGQKHRLELERTRLLGNHQNPTDALAGIALVLSSLRVKVVDGPEWWKQSGGGLLIKDEDALVALFNKIEEAEIEWRKQLQEMKKKALENTAPQS